MLRLDEQALICDLAETYGIYDYKSLPARTVAIFAIGLREDSRIKMKLNDEKIPRSQFLLAVIADRLGLLCYAISSDKENPPVSILEMLLGIEPEEKSKDSDVVTFDTPEDFEKAWEGGKT